MTDFYTPFESIERIEAGTYHQFIRDAGTTVVNSMYLSIYNPAGTLISSLTTATQSGTTNVWNSFYTVPTSFYTTQSSSGIHRALWTMSSSGSSVMVSVYFEVFKPDSSVANGRSGAYCTPADIVKRYKKIDTDKLNVQDIDIQIQFTEAYINSRLANKYTVPFTSVPMEIKRLTVDFTVIRIAQLYFVGFDLTAMNGLEIIRKQLEETLDRLADGSSMLADATDTLLARLTYPESTTEDYNPTFNMLDEISQIVDSDRLDVELDALK